MWWLAMICPPMTVSIHKTYILIIVVCINLWSVCGQVLYQIFVSDHVYPIQNNYVR